MTPDTGILTQLLNDFRNVFTAGAGLINGDANVLLGLLVMNDFLLAVLLNLSDADHIQLLIKKTLKYGFFIWLVLNYSALVNALLESFTMIGLKAGGGGISKALISNPSSLAEYGTYITKPIFDHIAGFTGMDALYNLGDIITNLVMGFLIIACFFIVGIQIFLTYLEFYIIGCLALILIPFGANKHTAFLGEKAVGAVFSFGIKLMVLSFVASAAIPLIRTWTLPVDPTLDQMLYTLLGSAAIAFLAGHAPGVAAGLLTGSPSLSVGDVARTAFAGGMGAVMAGRGVINAAGGMARGTGAVVTAAKIGHAQDGVAGAAQSVGSYLSGQSPVGQGQVAAVENMARQMKAQNLAKRLSKAKNG
jgi:type IV secretion system protein TrbL